MATDFERDLDNGFSRRIDELLSSALEDQAKEQQLMIDTVEAARTSLASAQQDIAALRSLVESGDVEVAELLDRRLNAADASMTAMRKGLDETLTGMQQRIDESLGEIGGLVERLSGWLGDVAGSFNEAVTAAKRETRAELETVMQRLKESEKVLSEAVATSGARSFDRIQSAREEIQAAREGIEGLGGNLEELRESLLRLPDAVDERLGGNLEEFRESLLRLPDAVDERLAEHRVDSGKARAALSRQMEGVISAIEALPSAIDGTLAEDRESADAARLSLSKQIDRVRATASRSAEAMAEAVQEPLREIGEAVAPLTEGSQKTDHRLRQVSRRLTEANARIEALYEGLIAYLAQRDERLEALRSEALAELVKDLTEGLKGRDRKRLGRALEDAEERRRDRQDAERYRRSVAARRAEEVAGQMKQVRGDLEAAKAETAKAETAKASKPKRSSGGRKAKTKKKKDKA